MTDEQAHRVALTVNTMEVGMSLSQAFERVSRDLPAPLGPEFGQVVRNLGMGLWLAEALAHSPPRLAPLVGRRG
jgi:Flp pilus assembly protein TadB